MGNKTAKPSRRRNQSANHFEEPEDFDEKVFITSSPKNNLLRKRMQRNSVHGPKDIVKAYNQHHKSPFPKKPIQNQDLSEKTRKDYSSSTNLENSESLKTLQKSSVFDFQSSPAVAVEIEMKIEETKSKIRECDEEIKNLESAPVSSTSSKLLCVSKMRRDQLNKFADQLILKQYYLDKSQFETSLPIRDEVEKQQVLPRERSKTPTFRDILRQQRKSQVTLQKVADFNGKLAGNFLDGQGRQNRHQVSQILCKNLNITLPKDEETPKDSSSHLTPNPEFQSQQSYPKLSPLASPSNKESSKLDSKPRHFPLFPSPKSTQKLPSIPWYLEGTDYDKDQS
jgi:hypothetical protein